MTGGPASGSPVHLTTMEPTQTSRSIATSGQALVEYTLVLAFVALATITALTLIGGDLQAIFAQVAGSF